MHARVRRAFRYNAKANGYYLGTYKLRFTPMRIRHASRWTKHGTETKKYPHLLYEFQVNDRSHKHPGFTSCGTTCEWTIYTYILITKHYPTLTENCYRCTVHFNRKAFKCVKVKVKIKVKAVCASYSTAAFRHIVLLPKWVPSFISRGAAHTKRRERPLLAKEGTIPGI